MNYTFFFSCLLIVILAACTPTKKVTNTIEKGTPEVPKMIEGCNAIATVKNFTHESGCQYLLQLKDGTLLLPGELPETKTPFYEGAGVKIGYTILDADESVVVKTACSSHDYVVKVTCIEQFIVSEEGMPATHAECQSLNNPSKFTWMREAISQNNPTRVNEYKYSVGYIYEFKNNSGSILYDCLGNSMCNTAESTDCTSLLETLSSPKVLLVVNN